MGTYFYGSGGRNGSNGGNGGNGGNGNGGESGDEGDEGGEGGSIIPMGGGTGIVKLYYHLDRLGSTDYLTDNVMGKVMSYTAYDDWGKLDEKKLVLQVGVRELKDLVFNYTGHPYDQVIDLYFAQARMYDAEDRRWASEDPVHYRLNWYTYCNNNPIVLIDHWGLAPTPMEAASMADHIYSVGLDNSKAERTIDGWRLIDVWTGREGMKMGFYIRDTDDWQNPSEYVIAFKGTTINNLSDWKNNVEQKLSPKSADMWDAISSAKCFSQIKCTTEITFTGHSKGGAEATAAAIATYKNVISFNTATLNFSDYGLGPSGYTASSTVYIVKGDILNSVERRLSYPLGKAVYLPQQYGGKWNNLWRTSLYQRVQNRHMPAVISALEEAGY